MEWDWKALAWLKKALFTSSCPFTLLGKILVSRGRKDEEANHPGNGNKCICATSLVACFSLLCSQMLQLNLSCQGGKEGWVCPAAYMLQHGLFPFSRLWIHRLLARNRVEWHHQGLLAVDGPCQLSWEHIHVLSKMPIFRGEQNWRWRQTLDFLSM